MLGPESFVILASQIVIRTIFVGCGIKWEIFAEHSKEDDTQSEDVHLVTFAGHIQVQLRGHVLIGTDLRV